MTSGTSKEVGLESRTYVFPRRQKATAHIARFGAAIRRRRLERGWTFIDFVRRANMNPTYLGFIERGENFPALDTVILLSKVLGAEASELFREIEERKEGTSCTLRESRLNPFARRTASALHSNLNWRSA